MDGFGRPLRRAVQSLLYGVKPTHVVAVIVAGLSLAIVCLLAVMWPVRRATALDPARALRAES